MTDSDVALESRSGGASSTLFVVLVLVLRAFGLGRGLTQWSCLHVIEVNSDAVSDRSTDAHKDL